MMRDTLRKLIEAYYVRTGENLQAFTISSARFEQFQNECHEIIMYLSPTRQEALLPTCNEIMFMGVKIIRGSRE